MLPGQRINLPDYVKQTELGRFICIRNLFESLKSDAFICFLPPFPDLRGLLRPRGPSADPEQLNASTIWTMLEFFFSSHAVLSTADTITRCEQLVLAIVGLRGLSSFAIAHSQDPSTRRTVMKPPIVDTEKDYNDPRIIDLVARFRCHGWCPWQTRIIFDRFTTAFCLYLSQFEKPIVTEDHGRCSARNCTLQQRDEESYYTQHNSTCGGCVSLCVNQPELTELLQGGCLPVIPVYNGAQKGYNLTLDPATRQTNDSMTPLDIPYVAVSHVWADGLGNLQMNSLPLCQLTRLSQIIRNLNDQMSKHGQVTRFWLDTLCVPPDAANQSDVQMLAIHKMRETYQHASCVLVLDKWLYSTDIANMTELEVFARIVSSN